jgi:hypothetical protein
MNRISRIFLRIVTLTLLVFLLAWLPFAHAAAKQDNGTTDHSDLNKDKAVDIEDLVVFSSKYLELNWETVDWCAFYEAVSTEGTYAGRSTDFYRKHFGILLGFINDYFLCEGGPLLLGIKNDPKTHYRVAVDSEYSGNYYISDPRVGSVFIYDSSWNLIGELKHLNKPLGVAIDSNGYLLVGNDGRNNIEVYDPVNGDFLFEFGMELVQLPTSITVSPGGDIYVTDSKAHRVWVFESSYVHVRTIGMPGPGDGQLKFPTDTAVFTRDDSPITEVYISDQVNQRIQVFDTHGNYLRAISPLMRMPGFCGRFKPNCPKAEGTFTRLQALEFDTLGRLHSLDIFEAVVTIIDPVMGTKLGSYGAWGDGAEFVRLPQDVQTTSWGEAILTDNDSAEIEIYEIP